MKNHFIMAYAGNKRTEVQDLYEEIKDKLDGITTIIEPFCGTSAFSYYVSLKHPGKFKYILNDNNKYLIKLYQVMQNEEELNKLIETFNKWVSDITKEKYDIIAKVDAFENWAFIHKYYSIRAGLFPTTRKINPDFITKMKDAPIINFLRNENIELVNDNAILLVDQYKDDEHALIFLDPPYLNVCNDFYHDTKINIYEYLYKNKIGLYISTVMLCLEDNWIIKLLFNGQIKKEYAKIYQGSKKKTTHLIITNY